MIITQLFELQAFKNIFSKFTNLDGFDMVLFILYYTKCDISGIYWRYMIIQQ